MISPPIRPLFFEFEGTGLVGSEDQFLVGRELLITPVLEQGRIEVTGYFPEAGGVWRDWYTHKVSPNLRYYVEADITSDADESGCACEGESGSEVARTPREYQRSHPTWSHYPHPYRTSL
jgi:hypothetical protein